LLILNTPSFTQINQWIINSWEVFSEDLDSAKVLAKKGYDEAQQKGDLLSMGRAMSYTAIYFDIETKTDSAIYLFYKAINVQETIHDTSGLITTYNNLGILYFNQYQYELATRFYQKAYSQAMLINNYSAAAGSLVNMGIIESYKPYAGNAYKYYKEAERLYIYSGDSISLPAVWSNTAKLHYDKSEYEVAYNYMQKSMNYADKKKHIADQITDRTLLANILCKMKKYAEAENYALEALAIAEKQGFPERKQYVFETLSRIYEGKGDYKTAYKYVSKYRDLRDSLINDEKASIIAEMQVKYEDAKKDNEINELKLEAVEKKNIELEKKRLQTGISTLIIGGVIGLIIFIVIVVLLIITIRLEKKNTQLQAEKKNQTEILLEQEKLLMRESHHRIKNNLQLINSILDLQSRSIADPEAKRIFSESRKRIQAISFAHQRLHGNDTVEKLNIKNFLNDLIQSIRSSSMNEDTDINLEFAVDDVSLSTEKAVPIGLIINELLTNSIKYAFPNLQKGCINISLNKEENILTLIIKDNGVGMQEVVQGTGFGHQLVKSMTRQLKAEYSLSLESGVKHQFIIPIT